MFRFFAPSWKSRSSARRLRAILEEGLTDDILLQLASYDTSLEVRRAAVDRLTDLNELYSLWLGERSKEGQTHVMARLAALINDDNDLAAVKKLFESVRVRSFPLATLLLSVNSPEIQEYLFTKIEHPHDVVRLIEAQNPFAERALAKIDELAVLKTLQAELKSNDKRAHQLIRGRIAELEAVKAKEAQAETLIEAYRLLSESEPLAALNKLSEIDSQWTAEALPEQKERDHYREVYLARYREFSEQYQKMQTLIESCETALSEAQTEDELTALIEMLSGRLETASGAVTESINKCLDTANSRLKSLKTVHKAENQYRGLIQSTKKLLKSRYQIANHEIESAIVSLKEAIAKKPHGELERLLNELYRRKELQGRAAEIEASVVNSLEKLGKAIEEGVTQAAGNCVKEAETLLNEKGVALPQAVHQHLFRELGTLKKKLYEMRKWARWGAENALQKLCDKAEALADEENNAYIVDQLKQLRLSWDEAARNNRQMAKQLRERFDAACEKAFASVEKERDKNQEYRRFYLNEAREILSLFQQNIDQIDWNNPNWGAIQPLRTQFLEQWNQYLNQYSTGERISFGAPLFLPRDKRMLEREMQGILAPLNKAIRNAQQVEITRLYALIEELKGLAAEMQDEQADIDSILADFKIMKQEFKPKLVLRYRDHRRLMKSYKEVTETLYAHEQSYRSASDEKRSQNAGKKRAVLAEMSAYLNELNGDNLAGFEAKMDHFQEAWDEAGVVAKQDHRQLMAELHGIKDQLFEARLRIENSLKDAKLEKSIAIAKALGILEECAVKGEAFSLTEMPKPTERPLLKRYECLAEIEKGNDAARLYLQTLYETRDNEARKLAVVHDILTSRETPAEDRALRVQYQLERLPDEMMGRVKRPINKQLEMLYNDWFEKIVGELEPKLWQRFFD